ncbi:hint-domain-containing protein [Nemania serpens]|nr:hint-domain-containing protein [Nemania serpens]
MSLMMDLRGQIKMAVKNQVDFRRWGQHYLISLWDAHAKQLSPKLNIYVLTQRNHSCNSFTDHSPRQYNKHSPLLIKCRDRLTKAFDDRPLRPSGFPGPCFAASSHVLLSMGDEVPVGSLQQGTPVQTPAGPRRARVLLKTRVHHTPMCQIGNLVLTPWHPVKTDWTPGGWVFPVSTAKTVDCYSGIICSVLLEPDEDVDAHAIRFGDAWGVTLGHGILSGTDVRAHECLGDYNAVLEELKQLRPGEHGVHCGDGTKRNPETGRLCGFERLLSPTYEGDLGSIDRVILHTRLPEICAWKPPSLSRTEMRHGTPSSARQPILSSSDDLIGYLVGTSGCFRDSEGAHDIQLNR